MLAGIASPVPVRRGTLRTFEDHWGFQRSDAIKTGIAPANCGDYRGSLRISEVFLSEIPILSRYLYGERNPSR
jgi:hypothetical protein